MQLTDKQQAVVIAMRDGAELIVHRCTGGATLMVGKNAKAIPFDVWHPIYEKDLMRRGLIVKGTARLYKLTKRGETEDLEPEKPDGVPED